MRVATIHPGSNPVASLLQPRTFDGTDRGTLPYSGRLCGRNNPSKGCRINGVTPWKLWSASHL
jgi:hypothetical protein